LQRQQNSGLEEWFIDPNRLENKVANAAVSLP
jgi:hypothetical protein